MANAVKDIKEKQVSYKILDKIKESSRGTGFLSWDLKAYIFGILFYRYLSERFVKHINDNEHNSGNADFDYAEISDDEVKSIDGFRDELIKDIGFFMYPSELFQNVSKNVDKNPNLNVDLRTIFDNIENSAKGADSEKCFSGLFEGFDVNSLTIGKDVIDRNKKLASLVTKVKAFDFGNDDYMDNASDVFGDAYEYLMADVAANAGRTGGEYYTPQCVAELLTKICVLGKTRVNKVYDPTCGSGSLLLQSAKILGKENVDIGYFGQEVSPTSYNLCRMNMFLHNIPYSKFDIACGNTLLDPKHWDDEPFEVIVSNPPYSKSWVTDDDTDKEVLDNLDTLYLNDERFRGAGVLAPKTKADFAFIMHAESWLATNGTAAIVCFPGIMYRSGAEQKIRKYLIDNNRIEAIIQLPDNLFFGTSISTCIMILKKNKIDNKTVFIDASKEFHKETNQNRLHDENIDKIIEWYKNRADVDHCVKVADYEDIVKAKYNLSVATYVEKEDIREVIDIDDLNSRLDAVVVRENQLRSDIGEIIKEIG